MCDFAGESRGCEAQEPRAGQTPEFGEDVIVDECCVLDLAVETADEVELRFGASVRLLVSACAADGSEVFSYLRLVKDFLRDFICKNLGRTRLPKDLVLAQRKEAFEKVLSDRKPDDELLPGKERSVEEMREALEYVSFCCGRFKMSSYLKEVHIVGVQRSVFDGGSEETIFPLLSKLRSESECYKVWQADLSSRYLLGACWSVAPTLNWQGRRRH